MMARRVIAGRSRYDSDAAAYLAAVEAADGQSLEGGVKAAINVFVVGCKTDGIWDAIKASCILAGARTLDGALVPLASTMPAPTQKGAAGGWSYNRKTGLTGNGTDNYLDSNRANNAEPQNSQHLAVFLFDTTSINRLHIGAGGTGLGASQLGVSTSTSSSFQRSRNNAPRGGVTLATGFYGKSRSSSTNYIARCSSVNTTVASTSQVPSSDNLFVFARNNGSGTAEFFMQDPMSFFSIGESLNLALLDARVSNLMTALGEAI